MKKERVNDAGRLSLQTKLQTQLFGVSKRGVSFSVQAHSDRIATIIISVAGLYGIAQNTVIVSHQQTGEFDDYGNPIYQWYGFSNGYRYTFDSLNDIKKLMNMHYNSMYRVLTVGS